MPRKNPILVRVGIIAGQKNKPIMKKHNLSYNLMEAIHLRGLTLRQAGFADPECIHPRHWDEVITFKQSIQMTEGNLDWPEPPLAYQVVGNPPKLRQNTTKGIWKTLYSSYRKYMRQCYEEREAGHPTAEDLKRAALKK